MKKNDWLLLTSVALYSFLFYQQGLGINFLIFTLFLLAALISINHELIKSKNWLLAAAGSLLSAGCVAYYGNPLSFTANFISLSLLSGLSGNPRTSVVFSLLSSWYSYVSAGVFIVRDYLEKKQLQVRQSGNPLVTRSWLIGLPVVVVLGFFFMYRAANPLFYNFTQQISFDFISWGWLIFTMGGFILSYGFFYHRPIAELVLIDALASNQLYPREEQTTTFLGQLWSLHQELFTGVILLSLLNLLLLVVNGLDVNFLYLGVALPTGITYSESVHQGIGMLITSILVAIAIILFYFRGNLNFYQQNKNLKLLAYGWIFQNAFMLVSTAYRNLLYIQEYSLTYKRIGVFIYLLLVLLGLFITAVKIARIKSNWYLFRQNAWATYLVLVLACLVNWDLLITRFNINRAQNQQKSLDREYLLSLSEINLPELLQLQNQHDKMRNAPVITVLPGLSAAALTDYFPDSTIAYKTHLHSKLIRYLIESQQTGWQSWNQTKHRVFNTIQLLEQTRHIPQLLLPEQQLDTLAFVASFPHVRELDLRDNHIQDLSLMQHTRQLERLDVSENNLTSISSLPALPHLKALSISNNKIQDIRSLAALPALEILDLQGNNLIQINPLASLPKLKELNLAHNQIYVDSAIFKQLFRLVKLDISGNKVTDLAALDTCTALRYLNVSQNHLISLHACQNFPFLEYLQVDGNPIQDYTALYSLKNLKILVVNQYISETDYLGLCQALPHTSIRKAIANNSNPANN